MCPVEWSNHGRNRGLVPSSDVQIVEVRSTIPIHEVEFTVSTTGAPIEVISRGTRMTVTDAATVRTPARLFISEDAQVVALADDRALWLHATTGNTAGRAEAWGLRIGMRLEGRVVSVTGAAMRGEFTPPRDR